MAGSSLEAGDVVARRYRIVRPLRSGGMGAVYEAIDTQTNRRRALKVLLESASLDETIRERFRREATVAGRVESDHVVEVLDAGVDERTGEQFLVMELLRQGEDLGAVLTRREHLPPEEVVALLAQVALGLDKVHREGIVHRDLKLENLFVQERDDGTVQIKILDFGVAKVFEGGSGPLATTQAVGTPLYMSPEQLTGDALIDLRADLYSLAHVAFTLLVGKGYWQPELAKAKNLYPFILQVAQGFQEPATERAAGLGVELPQPFDEWFARAAAKEVDQRFDDAKSLVIELANALGVDVPPMLVRRPGPSQPPPEEPTKPLPSGVSTTAFVATRPATSPVRRRVATAVIATIGLGVGAIGVYVAFGTHRPVDPPETPPAEPAARPDPPTDSMRSADTSAPAPSASAAAEPDAADAGVSARPAKPRPATRKPDPPPTKAPEPEYDPLDEL